MGFLKNISLARILFQLSTIGLLAYFLGGGMNIIVMKANDGKMPVAAKIEHVLFTIGDPHFGVKSFYRAKDYEDDPTHQVMRDDMRYLFLADRIPIEPFILREEWVPAVIFNFLLAYKFPIDVECIASMGDLFIWGGVVLSFFSIIFFWLVMFFHLARKTLFK